MRINENAWERDSSLFVESFTLYWRDILFKLVYFLAFWVLLFAREYCFVIGLLVCFFFHDVFFLMIFGTRFFFFRNDSTVWHELFKSDWNWSGQYCRNVSVCYTIRGLKGRNRVAYYLNLYYKNGNVFEKIPLQHKMFKTICHLLIYYNSKTALIRET